MELALWALGAIVMIALLAMAGIGLAFLIAFCKTGRR